MNTEKVEMMADGTAMQVDNDGKITVYLTDRAPVRIIEKNWPILASVALPLYRVYSVKNEITLREAIESTLGNADRYIGEECVIRGDVEILLWVEVTIRKHADGRCVLNGIRKGVDESPDSQTDSLGGVLLRPTDDLHDAIRANLRIFVDMCGGCSDFAFQKYIEACLLALPTEDILDDDKSKKEDSGFVVLSEARKVQISQSEWPVVSEGKTPVYYKPYSTDQDAPIIDQVAYGHERLVVRRHHDDFLVYGYLRFEEKWAAQFNMFNARGGELISGTSGLWDAIRRVGTSLAFSDKTIRKCLHGFSVEELD